MTAAQWTSSDSHAPDPVEIAFLGENVLMRSGAERETVLVFTQAEWKAFVAGAADGEFDYEV